MEKLINAGDRLRNVGIPVTLQRLAIAQVLLPQPTHLTADQVLARVKNVVPETSRATVYNTLKLFREKGLVRELIVDAERTVFDSNTAPHFHLYDTDTGQVTDIPAEMMQVIGTPHLPDGVELEEVDVIIRVRSQRQPNS
ncbi:MAG: Fur family transcriptional regulator [Rhodocyclaceae bacterium]|nr:Fur family transcriptional regulator [Rhodocyclaceae bacterium]